MRQLKDYIPDEWQSAGSAAVAMRLLVTSTSHAIPKVALGVFLPWLLGSAFSVIVNPSVSGDFVTAAITTLGIMAGFVMSLMLFTGRISGADSLSFEEAIEFRRRVLYLLWSQNITLAVYALTLLLGVVWFLFVSTGVESVSGGVITALFLGGLTTCFLRSALLPYQLYDMHSFSLRMLVDSKEKERIAAIELEMHSLESERRNASSSEFAIDENRR